jgi:DNA mismatch repair protein MutS2
VREREAAATRRLDTKLAEQLRDAHREIDAVMEDLRLRATELRQARRAGTASTGQAGALRAEARAAVDRIVEGTRGSVEAPPAAPALVAIEPEARPGPLAPGVTVTVGTLGLHGTVIEVHDRHAEVDVRGKRLRAPLRDLRVIGRSAAASSVQVTVDLLPRSDSLSEINVVGCTVDEATGRLEKFLDEATVTDAHQLRVVHGHGTGQLRKGVAAFLRTHPLVAEFGSAPLEEGGGGVTVVTLKD